MTRVLGVRKFKGPKILLLACVDDRPVTLDALLKSLPFAAGWSMVLVGQCFDPDRQREVKAAVEAAGVPCDAIWYPDRLGMHGAKYRGLERIEKRYGASRYVVASIDDDMEFLPDTKLDLLAQAALAPGVGFVSGGWVKTEKWLERRRPQSEMVPQAIVYTGGGMVFGRDVARVVLAMGPGDVWCDNSEWSLAVYVAGYKNYRHRGSMAIHRVCQKGGRKTWVNAAERPVPDRKWLRLRPSKVGEHNAYLIGADQDLTPDAHAEHARNRAVLMGGE